MQYSKDEIERVLLTDAEIQRRLDELAARINADYAGHDLLVVCILKGAVAVFADLLVIVSDLSNPNYAQQRATVFEVLDELGLHDDPIFKLAMKLEQIALEDDYFISRHLYPNVDFYSGIVQKAIGIPVPLFTAIFALARTVGWIAQLNEHINDPLYRIGRPRQLFTGAELRHVPDLADRK